MSFQDVLKKATEVLKQGGIIVYPTDTVWGIGCDAKNKEAVARIYTLKKRADAKSMLCLVSNVAMLERHISEVPDAAYDIIDLSKNPTTIIFDNPIGVAPNLIAPDNSLGIRVAKDKFCSYLSQNIKGPLVSTSANLAGQPTPKNFQEISQEILKGVDYIVPLEPEFHTNKPSTIIKLTSSGLVKVIRP
jgi:L-threonylcarbamoyladenylate synthase